MRCGCILGASLSNMHPPLLHVELMCVIIIVMFCLAATSWRQHMHALQGRACISFSYVAVGMLPLAALAEACLSKYCCKQ